MRGYLSDDLLNLDEGEGRTNLLTIEQLIGDRGCIQVTSDIGMNSVMTGITDVPCRNVIEDISHYYAQSEQIPTWISAYTKFNGDNEIELSRAVLVQLLPCSPIPLLHHIKR